MLRTPILVAVALAIAFTGGIYSSIAAIEANDAFDVLKIGPWTASPLAQTSEANPYAKARRARDGGFALGQAEGLVFTAEYDSAGRPLDGGCGYRIAGAAPTNRLWILRLVDPSGETLPATPAFPASLHSAGIQRASDGSFAISLDNVAQSGNWLQLDRRGRFLVELTLFDTPAAGNFGVVDLTMPAIERLECPDA